MARRRTCPGRYTSILIIGWLVILDVEYYHPLFLYESLWNLANMFLLLWISRRFADRLKNGRYFPDLPDCLPVGRFLLDFLRLDASLVGGININQTVMAVVAVLAASALLWRHRRDTSLAPARSE